MPEYEREKLIQTGKSLLANGYTSAQVYERLLSMGMAEREAKAFIFEQTGVPLASGMAPAAQETQSLADMMGIESKTSANPAETTSQTSSKPITTLRKGSIERAMALMDGGYDAKYIQQKLINEGFSSEEAQAVVQRLVQQRMPVTNYDGYTSGSRDTQLMIGVAMVLLGCAITFFSYQAAANSPTGGTYVILLA